MNLIFRTVRLENSMTSCRDKQTTSNTLQAIKSSSIFWSFDLAKCPPSNLCLRLARSQKSKEWLTSKHSACNNNILHPKNQKFQYLMAGNLLVIWQAEMIQPQMVWMVELATKPGANLNAVLQWKLAEKVSPA